MKKDISKPMNAQEIRKAYLDFFAKKQHVVIPRALLVPQNDPTTLFTGSGMQPLIPYLLGEKHPNGTRLVDSQTCLRAQDIEEVGDNRHTTFFEMLGNWSLGEYFKEQQIEWMFEFLTDVVGIDPSKLYVTCFIGAPKFDIPKDTVAADLWQELFKKKAITADIVDIDSEENGYKRGIKSGERIFYYDGTKNWWNRGKTSPETTPVGDPCGPDSEMFYDFGTPHDKKWGENCHPNCDCGRFMEIGNNVFMAYRKVAEGKFTPLEKPNIDHGSGLERIAAAAINNPDAFRISLLWPIIEKLEELSGKEYDSYTNSMRVIADHLRGATFLAVDGVVPSNKEQGYVMRRLMRRAIRFAFELGIEQNFMEHIVPVIAGLYHQDYPEVAKQRQQVVDVLAREEKIFRQTLRKGLREFEKLFAVHNPNLAHESSKKNESMPQVKTGVIEKADVGQELQASQSKIGHGAAIFMLYDTYGFPVELSVEEAFKQGIQLAENWQAEFDTKMSEQRALSHTSSKGTFKGGLADHSEMATKYHTATHLMYKALRMTLGDHVVQRGSNVTGERLRFDFSHPEKVTLEQVKQIEDIVNEQIKKDLKVFWQEYQTDEAFKKGALGAFGDKYGDKVKVYQAGEGKDMFSFEICGGPHVEHTGMLAEGGKQFKIIKEEACSAGVRRIKAMLV
ncbi:MAG TPA: alanine--tRNA ligase-related protein [Patescibacteria group bacterium]|jgi:alanyl-tRNA synthetase|nr:alanine--tRNA ligase-related protein [Patescibacteria group bacterium]